MTGKPRWALTLVIASLPLMGFWLYGVFDLDEGYYAAVVAEMNHRHEWITPYFGGHPWFEKPILLYWFAKPAVALFGQAIGPRLPSVLATIALYATCGLYLRRRVGGEAGRWCVYVLATSLIVAAIGRLMITDALLDLCIVAAFLSFYESLSGRQSWRLATAFFLGLTVLAKGPYVLPLFAAVAIWTSAAEKEQRPKMVGYWVLGTLVLAATVSLWYVPAYRANGQTFIQKFLVEQNLQRFGGGDEAHRVPILLWPIYFPVILLVGMLPWSFDLFRSWPKAFRKEESAFNHFLARWVLVFLLFFTISGTKLPHYILPAVPPLAMLAGQSLAERRRFSTKWFTVHAFALGGALCGAFYWYYVSSGFREVHRIADLIDQKVSSRPEKTLVVAYKLARLADAKGPLTINETANPSLDFYLDQDRIDFKSAPGEQNTPVASSGDDDLISLLRVAGPGAFIITRPGRIDARTDSEIAKYGMALREIPRSDESKYQLFAVSEIHEKTDPGAPAGV